MRGWGRSRGTLAVERSGLTPPELLLVVRACAYLRLPREMGDYFREFVALCLEAQHPDTAVKIRSMSDAELRTLYDYIHDCQSLAD
jgi:hypothetical protein